ncbi:hypothetical protein ACIBO2_00455 [Nonomuraea sp. NPDC050022]|uniref:hypothetical protein n=1 Tax=unclassified Nonomuraea TaxID=2593643 RepID=UPI0033E829D2
MSVGAAGGPRVVSLPLYDPVPILALYAVWRADHGPLVEAFLSCLPPSTEVTA